MGPIFGAVAQFRPHGIHADILCLGVIAFLAAKAMLEKVFLPADGGIFGRKAFPCRNRIFHLMVCGHAKQSVDVIWHHEEKQRMPSVDLMIVPDGTKQDGRRSIPGEFVASLFCGADRQKIDLAIRDPGRDFVGKVFSLRKFQGLTESNLTSFRQQNERRRRTVRRPDPTLKSASEMRVVGLDLRAGRSPAQNKTAAASRGNCGGIGNQPCWSPNRQGPRFPTQKNVVRPNGGGGTRQQLSG